MINEVTKYEWIKRIIEFLDNPYALKLEMNLESSPFTLTMSFKEGMKLEDIKEKEIVRFKEQKEDEEND